MGAGLLLVGICLLFRLVPAAVFGAEVADIHSYRAMAEIALAGDNIYHHPVLFPYTPLTLPLPAASLLLAQATGLPFDFTVKFWPIAADCGLALLVWGAARRQGWRPRAAWTAGLAYALNPVAILTSGFHGNQTTLGVLGAVGAYYCVAGGPAQARRGAAAAALLLGLGIAARSFPVLLLPVFVILLPLGEGRAGLGRRAGFVGLALLPSVLVSLPALVLDAPAYLRELLTYSGFSDQGWLAIRRAWGVVSGTGSPLPRDTAAWLAASKWIFAAGYAGLLILLARRPQTGLARGCLLAWLLFLVAYGGVSSHYLGWVVPFGLLCTWRWTAAYSLAAAAAQVGFYLTWFPAVLLGRYAPPVQWTGLEWRFYLVTLVLAWGTGVAWGAYVCHRSIRML